MLSFIMFLLIYFNNNFIMRFGCSPLGSRKIIFLHIQEEGVSQDSSAKFKALQLPFLCFYEVFKNMASDVLRFPGSVPHPHSHLDFPFLCPKCRWPTLFIFSSLHFLLWCSGKILCLVLRGHSTWTAPASSGFILDPLHLSAANWVIKNFLRTHTHPTVPAAVLLCTVQGVPAGYFGVLLFLDFSEALLLPSVPYTKMLIPFKSSSCQQFPVTRILGFGVIHCHPVLLWMLSLSFWFYYPVALFLWGNSGRFKNYVTATAIFFFFCQNSLFSILYMMPTSEIKLTVHKPPSINFSKSRVSKYNSCLSKTHSGFIEGESVPSQSISQPTLQRGVTLRYSSDQ